MTLSPSKWERRGREGRAHALELERAELEAFPTKEIKTVSSAPHPQISDADLKKIIAWVLSLK